MTLRWAKVESARIIRMRNLIADAAAVDKAVGSLPDEERREIRRLCDAARSSQVVLLRLNLEQYNLHKPKDVPAGGGDAAEDLPPPWLTPAVGEAWHSAVDGALTRFRKDYVLLYQACLRAGIMIPLVPVEDQDY